MIVIPFRTFKLELVVFLFLYFGPLFSNYKNVLFIHDMIFATNPEYFTLLERFYFWPMKFLARKSAAIITISDSEKRRIKQLRQTRDVPIHVVHNGVDERFKPIEKFESEIVKKIKEKYNLPEQYILNVGR